MARFVDENNSLRFLWRKFKSLDLFTRLAIITLILIVLSTPFIVRNYQLFNARGETQQEQNLQTIAQLRQSQENLLSGFNGSSPTISPPKVNIAPNSSGKFNLIDAIQSVILRILEAIRP
jgi:hypothetical protein